MYTKHSIYVLFFFCHICEAVLDPHFFGNNLNACDMEEYVNIKEQLKLISYYVTKIMNSIKSLIIRHEGLSLKYENLNLKYDDLNMKYEDLNLKHEDLNFEYEDLKSKHEDLKLKYNQN